MKIYLRRVVSGARRTSGGNVRKFVSPLSCVVVSGLLLVAGCVSRRANPSQVLVEPQILQSAGRFSKEYLLVPGDQIEVVIRRAPELSRIVTIRPDGFISLPLLDDVKAEGLPPLELDARLTEMFSERLVSPEVTVIATQVRQPMVYVVGDVMNPTPVPLRDAPTAIQAIGMAGGLRREAAGRDIAIIRLTEDGYIRAITLPVGGGQPAPYMMLRTAVLQADDVIFVPESGRSQFARFLTDFVNRPLAGFNSVLSVFVNFRFVQRL